MRSPICSVCLNSGILCRRCKERLEEGKVSDADVSVSRKLLELSGRMRQLRDVTVKKAIETGNVILIICGPGDAAGMIGRDGQTARKLERELGKTVKIVEETRDPGRFMAELLHPAKVKAVNVLYRRGGELFKVVVAKRSGPLMHAKDLSEISEGVFGKGAEVELV
jgi:transcription antitermination factor NusA-like protein